MGMQWLQLWWVLWVHQRDMGRGRNAGCAQGQLVLLALAGGYDPPGRGRSDDRRIYLR